MEHIDERNILCFSWPPQSPDYNPIEYVWRDMKAYIQSVLPLLFSLSKSIFRDHNITTMGELIPALRNFWETTVTPSYCQRLIGRSKLNILNSYDGLNRESITPSEYVYHR